MRIAAAVSVLLLLFGTAGPAFADGTLRSQESDGTVRVYQNVSIKVVNHTLRISTHDGKGTLIVSQAACSYVGDIKRCYPTKVSLEQGGATKPIDLKNWDDLRQHDRSATAAPILIAPVAAGRHSLLDQNQYRHVRDDDRKSRQRVNTMKYLALFLALVDRSRAIHGNGAARRRWRWARRRWGRRRSTQRRRRRSRWWRWRRSSQRRRRWWWRSRRRGGGTSFAAKWRFNFNRDTSAASRPSAAAPRKWRREPPEWRQATTVPATATTTSTVGNPGGGNNRQRRQREHAASGNNNIGNGNNNGNRTCNNCTVVRNPVYGGGGAYGWNHGVAWYRYRAIGAAAFGAQWRSV